MALGSITARLAQAFGRLIRRADDHGHFSLDQELLDALYAQARTYVHGHSVGGTNPSLLRAMAQSTPVIAYDCPYNQETTGGAALWFSSEDDLSDQLKVAETEPEAAAGVSLFFASSLFFSEAFV